MSATYFLLLQAAPPTTAFQMVIGGTLPTQDRPRVLAVFSLTCWWLIFLKWQPVP